MFTTKALLNPFSAIFAKVHHPPPIDKRESQRLLKALTVSFRTHLDREHGYLSQDPPSATPYTLQQSSAAPPAPATAHDADRRPTDRRPTDRHVRAILSNPLFSYEPSKTTLSSSLVPSERDPMDVFDQAVAKGLMNPQRATGVLIAKRHAIAQSSSVSVNQGMAASGTAHRVVSWLRSSGLERNLDFIKQQPLLDQLIPFMVEEGLDEIVWVWLDRWMRGDADDFSPLSAESSIRSSPLLSALVRAKVSPGTPLDAGYATMIRADDMFSDYKGFTSAALGPWRTLSMLSTVFAWQRTPPSEALFDSFAAMSEPLRGLLASIKIDRAHLDLYHPTHPDATAALTCLKSPMLDRLSWILNSQTHRDSKSPNGLRAIGDARKIAKKVVLMGTDAAQHLTRTGNQAKAEWVGNLLLRKLGNFLRAELVSASPDLHRLEPTPVLG
ncbi:unnamed protein product [Discula destructiva]